MTLFDPTYLARKTPGAGLKDSEPQIDMDCRKIGVRFCIGGLMVARPTAG